jgi:hypothetical protein
MTANEPGAFTNANDPRQTRVFSSRVLHHQTGYAKDRRIVLCHATEKSRLMLTCATDHSLETACPYAHKISYSEDFGLMLTYGLGGMRDDGGTLSFAPRRAPEDNAILRFPVTYRGHRLEVEIGLEKVEYVLREGECLTIRHDAEEIQLTRENPVAARAVTRW